MNPAAALAALADSRLDALVLILLGGLVALALPRITARRRRFWHPWINSGLLPLLGGLAIGPAGAGWLSASASETLRPLLGLLLAAAGVLVGTQLRLRSLRTAGPRFLARHSALALLQFAAAGVPLAFAAATGLPWAQALGCAALVAACAVATTQRPPPHLPGGLPPAVLVRDHVAPAGWWNLVAFAGGSLALSLGFQPDDGDGGWGMATVLLPLVLGLAMGWLSAHAPDRDDLSLFLLAILALTGGLAIAVAAVPLFFGLLVGVVLVNTAARRSEAIERSLDDLEQPLAVGIGLLGGLCLAEPGSADWAWPLALMVVVARGWIRRVASPTAPTLGPVRDRILAPPGAPGVILIACAVLAPAPAPQLVVPLAVMAGVLTILGDVLELRRPAVPPAETPA